jgi:hypothetical protein
MKKLIIIFLIVLLILLQFENLFAISEAAVLFLLISPSAQANGMGNTYMAMNHNEAMGMVYNPAHSGICAINNKFVLSFYPTKTRWLSALTSDLSYDCRAINIGIQLSPNIHCGIGYHKIYLYLGQNYSLNENGEVVDIYRSNEKAQALTLGIGYNNGFKVGFGTSIKYIKSNLTHSATATAFAFDVGAILHIPFFKLMSHHNSFKFISKSPVQPFFISTFGYSISNIGNQITYSGYDGGDPLPRFARTGFSFDGGFFINRPNLKWKIVTFKWAREGTDVLIKRSGPPDYDQEYQSLLGDINVWQDLVQNKTNKNITKTYGWEINLLEFISLRKGKYNDPDGLVKYNTEGFGLSSMGWFKLLFSFFPNEKYYKLFANKIDIQLHWSKVNISGCHPLAGTEFNSINIIIK